MNGENRIDVVVKGLILHNKKALIVRRSMDNEFGGGTWEFAGGKVEYGEDLIPALIREALEETGLVISVDRILYASTFFTSTKRQVVILKYLCTSENTEVSLSKEHTEYKWCTKDQLVEYLPPNILEDFEINNVFSLSEFQ